MVCYPPKENNMTLLGDFKVNPITFIQYNKITRMKHVYTCNSAHRVAVVLYLNSVS